MGGLGGGGEGGEFVNRGTEGEEGGRRFLRVGFPHPHIRGTGLRKGLFGAGGCGS